MKKRKFLLCAGAVLMAFAAASQAQVYTGTAQGKKGPVAVEVTLEGGAIRSVRVTSQHESPGISDPAIAAVPAAIVKHQSLNVEAVSGATVTSNAIIAAVADALS